jgi:hypothetical protein
MRTILCFAVLVGVTVFVSAQTTVPFQRQASGGTASAGRTARSR